MPRPRSILDRVLAIGADSSDSPELRVRKRLLVASGLTVGVLSAIWIVAYAGLGIPAAAAIPAAYAGLTLLQLASFARSRRYEPFLRLQLAAMVTLPFVLQAVLGGFANSSAVGLWAFVAALGAVFFAERAPHRWFAAFVALLIVSVAIDPLVAGSAPAIAEPVRRGFFALNVLAVATVTWGVTASFVRQREIAQRALDAELAKSEALLLNILPAPIAERLKAGEAVIADAYDSVTVLFADVAGFTPFAARTPPSQVIELLNTLFSAFDDLADRHGLEKIKTIGDAYMVVGGLPQPRPDHAEAVAGMALEMLDAGSSIAAKGLNLRIGMDLGPVTAGVIGRRKFAYDLWGDAVNTASRMESQGVAGRIQVTPAVEARLRHHFAFQPRGPVEIKGKGLIETYFLVGRAARPDGAASAAGSAGSSGRRGAELGEQPEQALRGVQPREVAGAVQDLEASDAGREIRHDLS